MRSSPVVGAGRGWPASTVAVGAVAAQRVGRSAVDNRGVVDNCRPGPASWTGSVGGLWQDRARP